VLKAGDRIRIVVQLIDSRSQCYAWSECYERSTVDIFDVQDEITLTIAERLSVELLANERNGVLKRFTEDIEAHNWYLKGLHYWNQRSREGMRLGRQMLRKDLWNTTPATFSPMSAWQISLAFRAFTDCYRLARPSPKRTNC